MTYTSNRTTITTAVLAAWITTGAMASDTEYFSGLPDSAIPYIQVANLKPNQSNDGRTVVQADHSTGLIQIDALLGQTNYEEQWAFVPAANLWIEIGRNEVATGSDSSVELDFDFLTSIAGVYDEIHILHFHPASYSNQGRWANAYFNVNYPANQLQGAEVIPIGLALPSAADVASSVQLVELLSETHPETKLQFTVVSSHGQVNYGPTDAGVHELIFNRGNPRQNFVREIAVRATLRRSVRNIQSSIENLSSPDIGAVISELCNQMSGEFYRVAFTPSN